jgi:hypothetical protein
VLVKYQLEEERLPSLDDLREELRADGMDVGRLEGEGRLRLIAGSAASGGVLRRSGAWSLRSPASWGTAAPCG